ALSAGAARRLVRSTAGWKPAGRTGWKPVFRLAFRAQLNRSGSVGELREVERAAAEIEHGAFPLQSFPEWLCDEILAALRDGAYVHDARVLEDSQVLGHVVLGKSESVGAIVHAFVLVGEQRLHKPHP